MTSLTWFHKIGRISANNGPILKIRNLACSVLQCRPIRHQNDVARDVMRAGTSRVRGRHYGRHNSQQSLNLNLVVVPVAMGLPRKPRGGFCSFLASGLVWWSLVDLLKMITFRQISEILEGFSITMATDFIFPENDPQVVKPRAIPLDLVYHSPRSMKNPPSRCRSSFQIFPFLSIDYCSIFSKVTCYLSYIIYFLKINGNVKIKLCFG